MHAHARPPRTPVATRARRIGARLALAGALCLPALAHGAEPPTPPASLPASQPAKTPPRPPAAPPAPPKNPIDGKIVEAVDSGGYTYVLLERAGEKSWLAMPHAEVKVGEIGKFMPGVQMGEFHSKTLDRTFKQIVFSSGPVPEPGAAAGPIDLPNKVSSAGPKSPPAEKGLHVGRAKGAGARTVAEVHEKRAALTGKSVVVRGKVVKISKQVIGRNWIHLQDGTGDPASGSHDLVVTSSAAPKLGEIVTVKGTVVTDKDFGAGYRYAVLVENGELQ